MSTVLKGKILLLLSMDSPSNYDCWEAAEESILGDLTEGEQEEYVNDSCELIEEWFSKEGKA